MTLFLTVGSTKFDSLLLDLMEDKEFQRISINKYGLTNWIIQHGTANPSIITKLKSCLSNVPKLTLNDYFNTQEMTEILNEARLVISHGGAGSALDILRNEGAARPFVMIGNTELMGNHQVELIGGLVEAGLAVVEGKLGRLTEALEACMNKRNEGAWKAMPSADITVLRESIHELFVK